MDKEEGGGEGVLTIGPSKLFENTLPGLRADDVGCEFTSRIRYKIVPICEKKPASSRSEMLPFW